MSSLRVEEKEVNILKNSLKIEREINADLEDENSVTNAYEKKLRESIRQWQEQVDTMESQTQEPELKKVRRSGPPGST